MSRAKAKIWARLIHKHDKTIEDVPEEGRDAVRAAYRDLYGEDIEE